MRNSYRIKIIAWIAAAIILLCAVPLTSMAGVVAPEDYGGLFVVNNYAVCDAVYLGEDNKTYSSLSGAVQGKHFTMTLRVSENSDIANLDAQSVMYYVLPDKVGTISKISSADVEGEYIEDKNMIKFTWQNGEKKKSFTATVEFGAATNVYDLYNIANINGTFYRLAKTTIKTDKELSKNLGKYLEEEDYTIQPYDFTDLKITINNKEYVYQCAENAEYISKTGRYYTAEFHDINGCKQKIGAMDGKTPRWLVPESQRYPDPNNTDSYHGNYTITLHDEPYEQDLYNMLKVGNSNNYYRLKKTRIIASNPKDRGNGNKVVPENEYTLVPNTSYDFTNVVLNIDGEVYLYSDHDLDGDFTSYFTVRLENVVKQDRTNGDTDWFANEEGWLDGSFAQYGGESNDIVAYHRNYIATLHKGKPVILETDDNDDDYNEAEEGLSIYITSDWPEDQTPYYGLNITLYAQLIGFENKNYSLQWQYSTDGETWNNVNDANGLTYSYTLDEVNAEYIWRINAYDISNK